MPPDKYPVTVFSTDFLRVPLFLCVRGLNTVIKFSRRWKSRDKFWPWDYCSCGLCLLAHCRCKGAALQCLDSWGLGLGERLFFSFWYIYFLTIQIPEMPRCLSTAQLRVHGWGWQMRPAWCLEQSRWNIGNQCPCSDNIYSQFSSPVELSMAGMTSRDMFRPALRTVVWVDPSPTPPGGQDVRHLIHRGQNRLERTSSPRGTSFLPCTGLFVCSNLRTLCKT